MELLTCFNIDDTVFLIKDNKITSTSIQSIRVTIQKRDTGEVCVETAYSLNDLTGWYDEKDLYTTFDSIINNLTKQYESKNSK